jgi:hypothetical protein
MYEWCAGAIAGEISDQILRPGPAGRNDALCTKQAGASPPKAVALGLRPGRVSAHLQSSVQAFRGSRFATGWSRF